jgi:hypothetical protein
MIAPTDPEFRIRFRREKLANLRQRGRNRGTRHHSHAAGEQEGNARSKGRSELEFGIRG